MYIIRTPMKTKFLLIISGLSLLTGCFYYAPKTVKYNGKRYKTDWCLSMPSNGREYYPCIKYDESKEPLFQKSKYDFWFTDEYEFDILYAEFVDSQFWRPNVYIAKDELKEAQKFYQDKTNFNYYIANWSDDESKISITDESEIETLNVAIDHIMESRKTAKKITLEYALASVRPTCYRVSKDGLFQTYAEKLYIYQNSIYGLKEINASKNTTTIYDLGEAGKALYSIFIKYNLIQER